ncbi:enoyl-CoA hydratase [Bacillus sp. V3-13]|uniref:enoyl-CoA hydratase/isomerase family protein n=1 Tax=Bacillus sp. V3-13 TaxID=2053728 RepID=UPI000C77D58A|nr:enoyl-CoA hydratase/isomerase family protein [Bacillus sp. V3-13]PLR76764.1 enoyl-CoA hydratase [Bacillus sp. V3-13]
MERFISISHYNEDQLYWIELNRPDTYNAFSDEMMDEIKAALKKAEALSDVRVVVFSGKGKVFASGADIKELNEMSPLEALFPRMQSLYDFIYKFPKPTVAAIDGYALGGGMELAAACDIRIATARSKFGMPECKLGVIPGAGGTQRLVKLIGEVKVKELVFLGEMIDGAEAKSIGFINFLSEESELQERAVNIAKRIAEKAPMALRFAKECIQRQADIPQEVGMLLENLSQAYLFSTRDKKEGVTAFIEKRKPSFTGY